MGDLTKGRPGIRWDIVEKIWKDLRGDQGEVLSKEKFGGYTTEVKEIMEQRERQALRNKIKEENHLLKDIPWGEGNLGAKTYLHGPVDYAKSWNCHFV